MTRPIRSQSLAAPRAPTARTWLGRYLLVGLAAGGLAGCDLITATPGRGSLAVNVEPVEARVVVTGPDGFRRSSTGGHLLTELAPGAYLVEAEAPGYADATAQVSVGAGRTASIVVAMREAARPRSEDTLRAGSRGLGRAPAPAIAPR